MLQRTVVRILHVSHELLRRVVKPFTQHLCGRAHWVRCLPLVIFQFAMLHYQRLPGLVNVNKKRTGKIHDAILMGKSTISTGPFSIAAMLHVTFTRGEGGWGSWVDAFFQQLLPLEPMILESRFLKNGLRCPISGHSGGIQWHPMSQPWLWVKRSVPGVHIKIAIGFKWIFIPPKDGVNFSWCFAIPTCIISDGYPLVIKHSYWKWWFIVDFPIAWWFSIVMLVYQRVNPHISWFGFPNHVSFWSSILHPLKVKATLAPCLW